MVSSSTAPSSRAAASRSSRAVAVSSGGGPFLSTGTGSAGATRRWRAERPVCGGPGRVEREAEHEPEAEGEHGDVLAEIADEAVDPDVVSPAADVIPEPVRVGLRREQHPA